MNEASLQQYSIKSNTAKSVMNDTETLSNTEMLNRIGHITRILHDSLTGLGLNEILEKVALGMPDARDRLNYVAKMT